MKTKTKTKCCNCSCSCCGNRSLISDIIGAMASVIVTIAMAYLIYSAYKLNQTGKMLLEDGQILTCVAEHISPDISIEIDIDEAYSTCSTKIIKK